MFKFDLGLTNLVQHQIDTKDEKPVKITPRRVPLAQMKEIEAEIQQMLANDIIQPSHSPWSTVMVVVKKATCIRICLDYRTLNEITVKDSYPLPRIDDSLDTLRGIVSFGTVDLSSGYYQVGMDPSDASKTAFATSKGLFCNNISIHFIPIILILCSPVHADGAGKSMGLEGLPINPSFIFRYNISFLLSYEHIIMFLIKWKKMLLI